jgi:DNA-binding winged helix-turn-helix (wHTH) protein
MNSFRIRDFLVSPDRNTIVGPRGAESHLEPKVMQVLCALVRRQGEVVSRQALMDECWGVEVGADEAVTRAISKLRKEFRDSSAAPHVIETIPKRGYRLALCVEPGDSFETRRTTVPGAGKPPSRHRTMILALAFTAAVKLIGWSSSSYFNGRRKRLEDIRTELNVTHLLSGSVARAGDRIAVSVELVDAGTGVQEWSEEFSSDLRDVEYLISRIVARARDALDVTRAQAVAARSYDLRAIELYYSVTDETPERGAVHAPSYDAEYPTSDHRSDVFSLQDVGHLPGFRLLHRDPRFWSLVARYDPRVFVVPTGPTPGRGCRRSWTVSGTGSGRRISATRRTFPMTATRSPAPLSRTPDASCKCQSQLKGRSRIP